MTIARLVASMFPEPPLTEFVSKASVTETQVCIQTKPIVKAPHLNRQKKISDTCKLEGNVK